MTRISSLRHIRMGCNCWIYALKWAYLACGQVKYILRFSWRDKTGFVYVKALAIATTNKFPSKNSEETHVYLLG